MATSTLTHHDEDQDQDLDRPKQHPEQFDVGEWNKRLHANTDPSIASQEAENERRTRQGPTPFVKPYDLGQTLQNNALDASTRERLQSLRETRGRLLAKKRSLAEQESSGGEPNLYKPGDGKNNKKGPSSRFRKAQGWWYALGALMAGSFAAATLFYAAISEIPRNLIAHGVHTIKERTTKPIKQRATLYVSKYLAQGVFGNKIAISDCASETGVIVTKDCFYRTTNNTDTICKVMIWGPWIKACHAWKDGRLEKRLAEKGMEMRYERDNNGERWVITTPAGSHSIDPNNAEVETQRFFSNDFQGADRAKKAEVLAYVTSILPNATYADKIHNLSLKRLASRKYNFKACNYYCQVKERITATPAKWRDGALGLIMAKIIFPSNAIGGVLLGCFLSQRDYTCKESDSRFRAQYNKELKKVAEKIGEGKLEAYIDLADQAKNREEKTLTAFFVKKAILKLAERLGPAVATKAALIIPYIGPVIDLGGNIWSGINLATAVYVIYDVMSSPSVQLAATTAKEIGYVNSFNVLNEAAFEKNGAKQIYSTNADGSYSDLLKGAEKSPYFQSMYGNTEGFKDYTFDPSTQASAADDEYPYICSNGEPRPANNLLCPNWRFDFVPPIGEYFKNIQELRSKLGEAGKVIDEVADAAIGVVDTINEPFDAAAQAALETKLGKEATDIVNKMLNPLLTDLTNYVLQPPFVAAEKLRGAMLLDAAWGGIDWIYNEMVRGGVFEDGIQYGWGRVLSLAEVQKQESYIRQQEKQRFAALPLWDKIFSAQENMSMVSRFAYAAPSSGTSPLAFVGNLFNPTTAIKFASLSNSATALMPGYSPYHIPQYGADFDEVAREPIHNATDNSACINDRAPKDIGAADTINMGLGRAENTKINYCLLDQEALQLYSAYFTNEPVDDTLESQTVSSGPLTGKPGESTGTFAWPIAESDFRGDTSCYGQDRGDYIHQGYDLIGKKGDAATEILAADGGTLVTAATQDGGAGNYVTIQHSGGFYTTYMHMSLPSPLKTGALIAKGDVLGTQGHTGDVYDENGNKGTIGASHLHFEVAKGSPNRRVSPYNAERGLPRTGEYAKKADCRT